MVTFFTLVFPLFHAFECLLFVRSTDLCRRHCKPVCIHSWNWSKFRWHLHNIVSTIVALPSVSSVLTMSITASTALSKARVSLRALVAWPLWWPWDRTVANMAPGTWLPGQYAPPRSSRSSRCPPPRPWSSGRWRPGSPAPPAAACCWSRWPRGPSRGRSWRRCRARPRPPCPGRAAGPCPRCRRRPGVPPPTPGWGSCCRAVNETSRGFHNIHRRLLLSNCLSRSLVGSSILLSQRSQFQS